jgi:hypothetical protein
MVTYQHRSENGGNMVHLDNNTWKHGEDVLVVSKKEFHDFVRQVGIDAGLSGEPNPIALNKRLMDILCKIPI